MDEKTIKKLLSDGMIIKVGDKYHTTSYNRSYEVVDYYYDANFPAFDNWSISVIKVLYKDKEYIIKNDFLNKKDILIPCDIVNFSDISRVKLCGYDVVNMIMKDNSYIIYYNGNILKSIDYFDNDSKEEVRYYSSKTFMFLIKNNEFFLFEKECFTFLGKYVFDGIWTTDIFSENVIYDGVVDLYCIINDVEYNFLYNMNVNKLYGFGMSKIKENDTFSYNDRIILSDDKFFTYRVFKI